MQEKKKLIYLEALRIIAIFCVLFNHSGESAYFYFTLSEEPLVQIISIIASSFCKIGVPLFFMISGVLLLNKEESLKDLYLKRVLKFVIILFVFCSLYYIYQCSLGTYEFELKEMIHRITTGQIFVSYWFLYSYIAFLMMLPILRKMAKAMSGSDFVYLYVVYVVANSIFGVLARTFIGQIAMNVPMATDLIMYPLLGYYLAYRFPEEHRTKKSIWCFAGLGILGLLLNLGVTMYDHHLFLDWNEGGLLLFIIMPATATFYLVKYFFDKVKLAPFAEKIIVFLGSGTFGMYVLEPYIKPFFGPYVQMALSFLSGIVLNLAYIVVITLLGCVISALLKKIPVIGKLL